MSDNLVYEIVNQTASLYNYGLNRLYKLVNQMYRGNTKKTHNYLKKYEGLSASEIRRIEYLLEKNKKYYQNKLNNSDELNT